jgi:branched-chain amino acid transport system substrate-binding protein
LNHTLRTALVATALAGAASLALAQSAPKLKVGLMLPATGTFAALGTAIENGFRLYVTEQGGKLSGREIEFVKVDDESDPSKATDNVNKLIKRWSAACTRGWPWRWPRWPRTAGRC